jgi:hypothetical protein
MHVHSVTEVREQLACAAAAGFVLFFVPRFAPQQLLIFECHSAPAHPIFAVVHVNVIELRHRQFLLDRQSPIVRPIAGLRETSRHW